MVADVILPWTASDSQVTTFDPGHEKRRVGVQHETARVRFLPSLSLHPVLVLYPPRDAVSMTTQVSPVTPPPLPRGDVLLFFSGRISLLCCHLKESTTFKTC